MKFCEGDTLVCLIFFDEWHKYLRLFWTCPANVTDHFSLCLSFLLYVLLGMMIRPTGNDLEIVYTKENTESWDSHVQALNIFLSSKSETYCCWVKDHSATCSPGIVEIVRQKTRAILPRLNPSLPTADQSPSKLGQHWLKIHWLECLGKVWKIRMCGHANIGWNGFCKFWLRFSKTHYREVQPGIIAVLHS